MDTKYCPLRKSEVTLTPVRSLPCRWHSCARRGSLSPCSPQPLLDHAAPEAGPLLTCSPASLSLWLLVIFPSFSRRRTSRFSQAVAVFSVFPLLHLHREPALYFLVEKPHPVYVTAGAFLKHFLRPLKHQMVTVLPRLTSSRVLGLHHVSLRICVPVSGIFLA